MGSWKVPEKLWIFSVIEWELCVLCCHNRLYPDALVLYISQCLFSSCSLAAHALPLWPCSVHYGACLPLLSLPYVSTRGNNYRLIEQYDLRKFNFTNPVVPVCNSLPNHVVSTDTINTFKNRLDKFWSDQEVIYDYNADLHSIGNRGLL